MSSLRTFSIEKEMLKYIPSDKREIIYICVDDADRDKKRIIKVLIIKSPSEK
ncbi:MAG: hypothetical protein BAJALOKI1v1_2190004 [Promethearchaeota archaeon]|nr:MAG: hypothetical protein BAJALOKI1v1_2190004 [Candidatus Lokiarchaeota archaeon]